MGRSTSGGRDSTPAGIKFEGREGISTLKPLVARIPRTGSRAKEGSAALARLR